MLQTFLRLGNGRAREKVNGIGFLDYPQVQTKHRHGNSIKNYTLPVISNLQNLI